MITISDGILTIPEGERFVGFTGDNLHSQKKFFIRSNTHSGWLYRLYLTFDDGRHNFFLLPATVSSEGTWLTWDIEESHILKSGLVKAQIKAFSKEKEVYHTTSDVFVAGLSTEEDEEFKNSNSEFLFYEKTLNELYSKMQTASAKMPYVGTNGNWFTYDINADKYVDSGVSSTVAIAEGSVTPEKLDRDYWRKLNRIPVTGYDNFDSVLAEENASDTVYRVEFSGISPVRPIVGEGSFLVITSNDCSSLMLLNLSNGKKWVYQKGSGVLTPCKINTDDIPDGTVTDEKLDRDYWRKLNRIPVTGYDNFDSVLAEENASDTVYRVEFSGISPVRPIVGDGSFLVITSNDCSSLMLLNLSNGKRWVYQKGSGVLTPCKINTDDITDGTVTDEKLDRDYWRKLNRIPVTGYDNFDSILAEENASDTVYRVEFSGISPVRRVVGDGSFLVITSNDCSSLMLLNIANGDMWIYEKGSSKLTLANGSGIAIVGSDEAPADARLDDSIELRYISEGVQEMVITLPDAIKDDFECSLVFMSPSPATSLICPSAVKWSGDDVASITKTENGATVTYNCLVPQPNKIYNVIFWYDGFNINAAVRGVLSE